MAAQTYQLLLNDCKEIITEFGFTHRWSLIELYWTLGKRINEEKTSQVSQIAQDLNKNVRTIQRAVQFYRMYPDLNTLPEGKNTSWHSIVNKYLPETIKKEPEVVDKELMKCPNCGFMFSKEDVNGKD